MVVGDLDLDSTRFQVDALGHTPTPFLSVKSCHLCFFPGERHLSFGGWYLLIITAQPQ